MPGTAQMVLLESPWGLLHPPAQDLGEEASLGCPYQALNASAGARWEQVKQPIEGAQGDVSPHVPAARDGGAVPQEWGTPRTAPAQVLGGCGGHALLSPPHRALCPLETHQSISRLLVAIQFHPPSAQLKLRRVGGRGAGCCGARGALGEQLVATGGGSAGWRVGMQPVGPRLKDCEASARHPLPVPAGPS